MRAITWVCGIIVSLLFFSCSDNNEWANNIDSDGNVWLKYQSMERVSESSLFVEVVDVEDNRCPIGEVCSSQGFATITLKAHYNGEQKTFQLQSGKIRHQLKCTEVVFGHKVQVVNLNPYPYCNDPLKDKRSYIVLLKVVQE